MSVFYVPSVNLIGKGVINEFGGHVKELGFKKALIVTDHYIASSDILPKVIKPLEAEGIEYVVFEDVDPNPSCKNVYDGLATLQENDCDFIISVGGGSPKMLLAVFPSWRQMVVSRKIMKGSTSLKKRVCQL